MLFSVDVVRIAQQRRPEFARLWRPWGVLPCERLRGVHGQSQVPSLCLRKLGPLNSFATDTLLTRIIQTMLCLRIFIEHLKRNSSWLAPAVQWRALAPQAISGSLSIFFLFDVCDEIRLDELRKLVKAPPAGREPPFRQPTPEYVQFARPPVIEAIPPVELASGERALGRIA